MNKFELTLFQHNIWGNMAPTEKVANRNQVIKDLILSYNADVCCFQECNPKTSRAEDVDIAKLLSDDFSEAPTEVEKLNFTPIFYNKHRFTVVDSGFHLFEGKNDMNSKSFTWCVLCENKTNIRFGVISVHFWWKYGDEEHNQQRLENAKVLISFMNEMKQKYNISVMATGDYNCGLESRQGVEPWLKMKEHMLDVREYASLSCDTHTLHQYPKMNENGVYVATSTECSRTLDHAFVTDTEGFTLNSFSVDNSEAACSCSDHCPLIIKVTVKEI